MSKLSSHPRVVQLARDLGLTVRGDCLTRILEFAVARVAKITADFPPGDLDGLRRIVANRLSLKIEYVHSDSDVDRLANEYRDFHPVLRQRLRKEFLDDKTEGITLQRDQHDPKKFMFLAVIDARGSQSSRAYFTAWHEIVHLLVHPPQLAFPGFRRTPLQDEIPKDPFESVIDHVAGKLAFYRELFEPALHAAVGAEGDFSFNAIDIARQAAAPSASLFATCVGSIQYSDRPTLLVSVAPALKKSEARSISSSQTSFNFANVSPTAKLRVINVIPNAAAERSGLGVHRNMRVPLRSVIHTVHDQPQDIELAAVENQCWWETSKEGSLRELPITVRAIRRGRFVYGLIVA